ncbi:uncharacterized protein RSE6_14417 [Rhynchosporium secalis]|uniref:Uncharacterized protein n=1 Tax=Rhynchosporium secalis TaxID=38038 RepID=A0A1E1MV91_RHYSE|nr:uncharacterized protein RSE6_14417 [Rhynchosporium secalis]
MFVIVMVCAALFVTQIGCLILFYGYKFLMSFYRKHQEEKAEKEKEDGGKGASGPAKMFDDSPPLPPSNSTQPLCRDNAPTDRDGGNSGGGFTSAFSAGDTYR